MGKVYELIEDKIIPEIPDRSPNRLKVYRMENGEVVITFRNFKIQLLTPDEINEWRHGFTEALENLKKYEISDY